MLSHEQAIIATYQTCIVAVALRIKPIKTDPECPDYNHIIISQPKPARHGDLLTPLSQMNEMAAHLCEQGFLTNKGEFVDRYVARIIALTRGQMIRYTHQTKLFSEDLW